jgi:cell division protease FtsH
VNGTYERVRGILTADRDVLEELSQRLLEVEVVDEADLRRIMGLPPRTREPLEERVVETPPPQTGGGE